MLALFLVDTFLKLCAVGFGNFFKCSGVVYREPWDHFRVVVLLLMVLDFTLFATGLVQVRVLRALRPLLLVSYVRELRRWMYLCYKMLPKLMEMVSVEERVGRLSAWVWH